eukprot:UN02923
MQKIIDKNVQTQIYNKGIIQILIVILSDRSDFVLNTITWIERERNQMIRFCV